MNNDNPHISSNVAPLLDWMRDYANKLVHFMLWLDTLRTPLSPKIRGLNVGQNLNINALNRGDLHDRTT